jgi:predicted P-loop ATPase
MLERNSAAYELSTMPILVFEEMSGAGKADIEDLKAIMTDEKRMMEQKYKAAGIRDVITTFIGASNKRIEWLIKDETGNRRLIQFATNKLTKAEANSFDAVKIWRSIDEDALEPPRYATAEDRDLIESVQEEQRYKSPIEEWIAEGDAYRIPWDKPTKALKLYDESFRPYMHDALSTAEAHHWSKQRMETTLLELAKARRIEVKVTRSGGSPSYRIMRPAWATEYPLPNGTTVIRFPRAG